MYGVYIRQHYASQIEISANKFLITKLRKKKEHAKIVIYGIAEIDESVG